MSTIKLTPREKMRYVYKDGTLRKFGMKPEKHLMRKFGNTPGIDKMVLDTYPDCVWVKCYTNDGRRFKISALDLLNLGKVVDYGHGAQYFAPASLWEVTTEQS